MNNLETIQQGIDGKHPDGTTEGLLGSVIDTANILKDTFPLSPEQTDKLIEFIKEKLENLMSNNSCRQIGSLGTMKLYSNENGRSKSVSFTVNYTEKSIELAFGEYLDSAKDQEMWEKLEKAGKPIILGNESESYLA